MDNGFDVLGLTVEHAANCATSRLTLSRRRSRCNWPSLCVECVLLFGYMPHEFHVDFTNLACEMTRKIRNFNVPLSGLLVTQYLLIWIRNTDQNPAKALDFYQGRARDVIISCVL